jgi:hypothetical protein
VSKPETMMIDDVKYVRADAVPDTKGDVKIVVLDRGFVYVGRVEHDENWLTIRNAKNIRYWGTSKGLGELVNGPLKDTKLDASGTVRAPMRAVIAVIDASEAAWKSSGI